MSRKLRVMHLMGAAGPGGAETFFIRLMEGLHKRDEVELLPVVRKGSWAAGRLQALGIPHEEAGFGGWLDWRTGARVKRVAEGFGADIVQGWMNRATRFMPEGKWRKVARLGGYYKLKNYFGKVDYLIANTEDIARYCKDGGWPEGRVNVIGNFIPSPPDGWQVRREAARAAWGIPADATVLLMSGRLHAVKGVDVALRALAVLPEHVWLLLAGEGRERVALEKLAADLGVAPRVVFAGWQDEVDTAAAAADIWLAPSRVEPLGNTVLDGWAHGLPVIASKTVGPLGLMEDGRTGLLVAVDDAGALGAAVTQLLEDGTLAGKLAKAGHKVFASRYSEDVVVGDYVGYYANLVGKGLKREVSE
ncbi:MAG: glycosyltransferase [Pseudomonadaceae bacterium]|nr:glycosyltransferase [Pseudomonadaceae bacterium]